MTSRAQTALIYAIFIALGGFVFGYDASVISGVVGYVAVDFSLSDSQMGMIVAIPTMTAIFAALTVTPLADMMGRKKTMLMLAFLYLLSAVYSAFAPDYLSLVIARGIGGYAFGSLMLAPIYIAETSPAGQRGLMVSVNQLNIVLGLSAAYFVNYYIQGLSTVEGGSWASAFGVEDAPWRMMLFVEAIPAALWFLLMFTVPESPRWLMASNRESDARAVLAKIIIFDQIEAVVSDMKASVNQSSHRLADSFKGLLSSKMHFILLIGILLAVVQQATGINAIFFYAPTIFEQSGVGSDAAFMQAILVGVINVVFTVVAMVLIDKLGRKPLLMIGLTGVVLSLMTTAYGFSKATFELSPAHASEIAQTTNNPAVTTLAGQKFTSDVAFKQAAKAILGQDDMRKVQADMLNKAININATLVLFGVLAFVASFAVSLGPVMWVMLSEIFPNNVRALAMGFVFVCNSGTSFAVQYFFPMGLSQLGAAGVFVIFGLFALVGLVLVGRFLPETKGKSLEELEDILVNNRVR